MPTLASTDTPVQDRQRKLLGEELPVFCERCGYHLHGLPPVKCEHCDLLHLRCPECGHTQPVNSLRPAMQQWLGRVRATGLLFLVTAKLLLLAILAFIWVPIGFDQLRPGRLTLDQLLHHVVNGDEALGLLLYAFSCGLVFRYLAMRWRRGWEVGLLFGAISCLMMCIGYLYYVFVFQASPSYSYYYRGTIETSLSRPILIILLVLAAQTAAGAICWPAWVLAVKILLPQKAGERLLEWQRAHRDAASSPASKEAALGRT